MEAKNEEATTPILGFDFFKKLERTVCVLQWVIVSSQKFAEPQYTIKYKLSIYSHQQFQDHQKNTVSGLFQETIKNRCLSLDRSY